MPGCGAGYNGNRYYLLMYLRSVRDGSTADHARKPADALRDRFCVKKAKGQQQQPAGMTE